MKKNSLQKNEKSIFRKMLWSFYAFVVFLFIVFSLYHLLFAKTVIPGVHIKEEDLGRLNFAQTLIAVKSQVPQDFSLNLVYRDQTFLISSSEIGLTYDIAQTAKDAFDIGRGSGFLKNTHLKLEGLFGNLNVNYAYSYDVESLDAKIEEITRKIETPHRDASFALDGSGNLFIAPEEVGIVVDKEGLRKAILENVSEANPSDIAVQTTSYEPALTKADLGGIEQRVSILINKLPLFAFEDKSWQITKNDFLQMVIFSKKDSVVSMEVDKEKIKKFVTSIAEQVNRPPKSEIFKVEGDRVIDFRLPTPGYVVKEHSAVEVFSLALLDVSMERQLDLPAEEFLPSAGDNSYGIKELLGEGSSTFIGSSQGRLFNIELASKNLNGVLIAPGEIFSFNTNVGPIDYAHGFTSAYIISKGRTVLGEGGGVCQVSTTLFRAVLNSGLPIISRTAHAYRVNYYEQDMPVGFDATIYQPTVDFKFKNDTQNYVLVQSEFVSKESKLYFRFYGTKDGRVVKSLESKILSQSPPPEPLYQDDPSLSSGTVNQVDWPAWGAVVELKRVVEKDNKVLYDDTFISNYQPWRAVYLVGTAE